MPIEYYLQPYLLASKKNQYKARIVPQIIYDEERIIHEMLKTGSTITEADCKAVLSVFFDTVAAKVAQGNHVNTPLFNIKPSISGVFDSAEDSFDVQRHSLKGLITSGTMLTKAMVTADLEKTAKTLPTPILASFIDSHSGAINSVLTSGAIGTIVGLHLKFNPENDSEGIYFIATDGSSIKVTTIASASKRKLIFQTPELQPGHYHLEVRKDFGKSRSILRKSKLNFVLSVT